MEVANEINPDEASKSVDAQENGEDVDAGGEAGEDADEEEIKTE
jgi:hypothetical protein